MISGYNNIIKVFQNDDKIIGNINNYKSVYERTSIGEHLTTTEPFEIEFPYPIDEKYFWTFYFYPKGQWNSEYANSRCCFYLKLVPRQSDKVDKILTVDIQFRINVTSNLSGNVCTPKTRSQFILNDIRRKWAGPYEVISEIDHENIDNLTFTCDFGYASIRSTPDFSSETKFVSSISLPPPEMLINDTAAYNESVTIKESCVLSAKERAEIAYKNFLGSMNHGESHGISLSHQNKNTEQIPVNNNDNVDDEMGDVEKNFVPQGYVTDALTMEERINFWNNPFNTNVSYSNMVNEQIPVGGNDEMGNTDNDLVAQEDITDEQAFDQKIAFWKSLFKLNVSYQHMDIEQIPDSGNHDMSNAEKTKLVSHEDGSINQTFDEKVGYFNSLFKPNVSYQHMDIEQIPDRGNHEMSNAQETKLEDINDEQTFDEKHFRFDYDKPSVSYQDMVSEQIPVKCTDEMSNTQKDDTGDIEKTFHEKTIFWENFSTVSK